MITVNFWHITPVIAHDHEGVPGAAGRGSVADGAVGGVGVLVVELVADPS